MQAAEAGASRGSGPWAEQGPEPAAPLIEGIKHCILAYMFRLKQLEALHNPDALSRFFYHFNDYMGLVLWKVVPLVPAGSHWRLAITY